MKNVDLIIIGGGSAGLAAAVSAFDAGVSDIVILERTGELGGILNQCIHNGFGLHRFKEELTGPEYAYRYIEEIKKRNIKYYVNTQVLSVTKDKEVEILNEELGNFVFKAKAIVFAAGCNERTRGQISIPGERPKGVYTAGLAQKYMNIDGYLVGKNVYILGSGDIGLIMARRMTLEGAHVIGVSELMPYSNGLNRNIVQCLNDFNIPLKFSNTVTKIIGKEKLEAIELSDVDEKFRPIKGTEKIVPCDTLLLSIGLYPFNDLLKQAGAEFNPASKGSKVYQNLETTLDGIFACGNVLHVHDLVDFVSEEGEIAGKNAAELILNGRKEVKKVVNVSAANNVLYVLPCAIKVNDPNEAINFSFRVRKPIPKGKIVFKNNGEVVKSMVKQFLIPSEMVKITLKDLGLLDLENISVEVEEL